MTWLYKCVMAKFINVLVSLWRISEGGWGKNFEFDCFQINVVEVFLDLMCKLQAQMTNHFWDTKSLLLKFLDEFWRAIDTECHWLLYIMLNPLTPVYLSCTVESAEDRFGQLRWGKVENRLSFAKRTGPNCLLTLVSLPPPPQLGARVDGPRGAPGPRPPLPPPRGQGALVLTRWPTPSPALPPSPARSMDHPVVH